MSMGDGRNASQDTSLCRRKTVKMIVNSSSDSIDVFGSCKKLRYLINNVYILIY